MKKVSFILVHKETGEEVSLDEVWLCSEYSSLAFGSSKEEHQGIGNIPGKYPQSLDEYKVWVVIDHIKYELEI